MKLGPVKKVYTSDGHRSLDPESTLKTIEPLTKIAGITRVADITDLESDRGAGLLKHKAFSPKWGCFHI